MSGLSASQNKSSVSTSNDAIGDGTTKVASAHKSKDNNKIGAGDANDAISSPLLEKTKTSPPVHEDKAASLGTTGEHAENKEPLKSLSWEMEALEKHGVVEHSTLVRACMDDYPDWSEAYVLNLLTEGEGRFWEKTTRDGQILYLPGNPPFGTKQETFDG
jgi:hypothetical protein